MEMRNLRSELHVAQQARRDKLRIPQDSGQTNNENPFLVSSVYTDYVAGQEAALGGYESLKSGGNMGFLCPASTNRSGGEVEEIRAGRGPQCFSGTWKSIGSEWVPNQNPMFVGEGLSSSSSSSVKQHLINSTAAAPILLDQDPVSFQDFGVGACPNLVQDSVSFRAKAMEEERLLLPAGYAAGQALSLSLSSVPLTGGGSEGCFQDTRNLGRILGPSRKEMVVAHRNPGPLGPFTGYATILRNSKFLRPAQQILEDLCAAARPKITGEIRVSGEDIRISEHDSDLLGGDSGGSSQVFNVANDQNRDTSSSAGTNYSPENLQTRAQLLFLQEEVSKRYIQYNQQIQLVISSFETVAGLSSATPYVFLAVKSVSRHFRLLKNAIADHLKTLRNALGHDSSSSCNLSAATEADPSLKFAQRSFLMSKGAATHAGGLLDTGGHHVWRPQRGLPERAVAILRAWLFDHFLHPYPTDTDKHMLASQTGLTRSQVSNWFINARVRIWKPMVEEIHMLETKGGVIGETGPGRSPNTAETSEVGRSVNQNATSSVQGHHHSEQQRRETNADDVWNQDKRLRIEYHTPAPGIGRSMIGYGPGSVSLTLGLRQSGENGQLALPENHHLRQHFGGQFIRDFVG